ncbi:uncharacterized protein T551_00452 [Pneumocystis jirovecii RU7]|uniref:Potassium transport protein n=1 Tax=Pneumocystis jirovecii (strain RU7) TaxID=1408657 RepID=A0A0W4ZVG0_PNEJ7|nr:uncharacterized protein T551_00452 [Pneumocystis jirovecii RU7]KTW32362.1 hypothetical protein T551_00452 [Pneumocystis jirovecii RU7]
MGGTIEKLKTIQILLPKVSFLWLHCIYIAVMILIGTFLIYLQSNIQYIDAFFLATSAATQAGLVTLDINTLSVYQQVVLYIIPMLTTPIFIHSLTAIVRLFLIRSKFDNIVQQARTQSLRKNQCLNNVFMSYSEIEERGVGDRPIHVLLRRESVIENETQSMPFCKIGTSFGNIVSPIRMNELERRNDVDSKRGGPLNSAGMDSSFNANRQHNKDENFVTEFQKYECVSLQQERHGNSDIRFGDLPVPVRSSIDGPKDDELYIVPDRFEQENQFNNKLQKSKSVEPQSVSIINEGLTNITRLSTYDNNNYYLRMRKFITIDRSISKVSTFDRYISNAFWKKRDSSPFSQRTNKSFPYLSYQPTIGRNSAFVTLTKEQRDELGGIEYRALKLLCWILVCYYVLIHVFAAICFLLFSVFAKSYKEAIIDSLASPSWWAFFTSASLFNDFGIKIFRIIFCLCPLGMTLNATSMVKYRQSNFVLILGSFLIIAGNTAFPILLRFFIWIITFTLPKNSLHRESLHFLLDHPRRCFTLLFPSRVTFWLFALLIILNIADTLIFIALDFNNPSLEEIGPTHLKVLNCLFQSIATRTAGFTVVSLSTLHTAVLVSYMFMMYISVFPKFIIYMIFNFGKERSLGIYSNDDDSQNASFVGTHIRQQLSFDLWYIFLGLFIICIVENKKIKDESIPSFNVFSVLFEIISAYCTVGLSFGSPDINSSFSSKFSIIGKLVIISLQIRGRHRGLPYTLDRAVILPTEKMGRVEEEDYQRKTKVPVINNDNL